MPTTSDEEEENRRTGGQGWKRLLDMKLWTFGKISLIVVCAFTITLYVLSFYFDFRIYDVLRFRPVAIQADQRVTNRTKRILFWNTMFGNENFYMGQGDIFAGCPVDDCYATHDRLYAEPQDFDAVLFHGNELKLSDLPRSRSPRQWYVFVSLESPANWPLANRFYEDFFNLTMTYRLDSDVPWTYGVVEDARTGRIVAPSRTVQWNAFYNGTGGRDVVRLAEDASLSRLILGKTRPVAWFVSNCVAKSGRQAYVDELSKHIDVDVYGKCGSRYCSRSVDCFASIVEPEYFFYLSFENTLCDDYVTEKLYKALRYNVVPIVYGGADYSRFAPPGSHINVFDFDTPKELADYLKRLMDRPAEYAAYLAWKKYYKVEGSIRPTVCNLCKFLHERNQPRMYNALSNWYSRSRCPLQELLRYYAYVTGSAFRNKD